MTRLKEVKPRVRIGPGIEREKISGSVLLEHSSYWPSASVILGATATWGDRTRNFVDLDALFTPAESEPRRAKFEFTDAKTSGIYHKESVRPRRGG